MLKKAYSFRPCYFTVLTGAGISACLPIMEIDSFLTGRRGVSLPFTDFCEPIASSVDEFQELFEAATEYGKRRGWKSLEMRGAAAFLGSNPSSSTYLTHTLDLASGTSRSSDPQPVPSSHHPGSAGSFDSQPATRNPQPVRYPSSSGSIFSTFRESTKRNIRKASESGVKVELLTTEQSVRDFYRLNQKTRRDHGLPPQPYRFFEEVYEHVISKGQGFVAAAFLEKRCIAASVYFHFGKNAIYKYGASDKQYQHLRPNNIVMAEAIRWYAEHGYSTLSFGRTDLGHEGLRQFKNGWGVTESPLSYYRYALKTGKFINNDKEQTKGAGSKAVSFAPLPVLRAVGSLLYRHMG